jgi:MFS family permease
VTLFLLTDRPEQAKFLTGEERTWLAARLAAERKAKEAVRTFTLWQAMRNPKVLLLALNYFGIVTASLGMLIFIPQVIQSLGHSSNMAVGWLTMIPYVCGVIAMVIWGRISDRMKERRWHLLVACWVEGWKCPPGQNRDPQRPRFSPPTGAALVHRLVRFSSSFLSARHAQRHLRLGVTAAGRLCLFGVRFSHWTIA